MYKKRKCKHQKKRQNSKRQNFKKCNGNKYIIKKCKLCGRVTFLIIYTLIIIRSNIKPQSYRKIFIFINEQIGITCVKCTWYYVCKIYKIVSKFVFLSNNFEDR